MLFRQFAVFATMLLLFISSSFAASCTNCGKVIEVQTVKVEGKGSGLGAVAGGVAGGLLGNQVGKGSGNTIATLAGAAGGAYAGHQVEKKVKEKTEYQVVVKMDNGDKKQVRFAEKPAFIAGDRVKLENGTLTRIAP